MVSLAMNSGYRSGVKCVLIRLAVGWVDFSESTPGPGNFFWLGVIPVGNAGYERNRFYAMIKRAFSMRVKTRLFSK